MRKDLNLLFCSAFYSSCYYKFINSLKTMPILTLSCMLLWRRVICVAVLYTQSAVYTGGEMTSLSFLGTSFVPADQSKNNISLLI